MFEGNYPVDKISYSYITLEQIHAVVQRLFNIGSGGDVALQRRACLQHV
jgi:hypothetical protein